MGMAQGALRSIRIQNFRRFSDLTIPRLGMVNLLVGRNGTGKSTVLEAVRLLMSDPDLSVHRDISDRQEDGFAETLEEDYSALDGLKRRGSSRDDEFRISDGERFVTGGLRVYQRVRDEDGDYHYEPVPFRSSAENVELVFELTSPDWRRRYSGDVPRKPKGVFDSVRGSCVFIGTGGLSRAEFAHLWISVALTELEDRINQSIRNSFTEVERVSIVPGNRESSVIAKVRGVEQPVALKNLGEGATRFFALALAAAKARNGVLLVDEVEVGLHYSIQVELWRLLVQMALEFNFQIFATTHSEDAIRAFSIATKENEAVDGRLIRLQSRGGEIEAVEYDEGKLWDSRNSEMEIR